MAVPGWLEAPAGIFIKEWECSPTSSPTRGSSINKAKLAVEARGAEALVDTAKDVSEKKHVGFLMAPVMSRVFPIS